MVSDMDGAKVCLMPRLSLTEVLLCAGLIRSLCEVAASVLVVVPKAHATSVRRLFDERNVRFAFVDDWASLTDTVLTTATAQGYDLVPLASYRDACPYTAMGLAWTVAATNLRIQRIGDAERRLLDAVKRVVGDTYVVVHENAARRIRPQLVPAGMPVVRTDDPRFASTTFFDWIQVLDHAMQLHAIDSSYLLLADLLALRPRKFCHAYANDAAGLSFRAGVYRDVVVVWG